MMYTWCTYRQDMDLRIDEPCIYCINKIAIYQRLLVEFSYDLYLIFTLRFTCSITINLCD